MGKNPLSEPKRQTSRENTMQAPGEVMAVFCGTQNAVISQAVSMLLKSLTVACSSW